MSSTAGGRSVLVVDDDQDVGGVIAAVLSDEGYTVSTISDVSDESFRAAIGQLEPDLILLDGAGPSEYGEGWLALSRRRGWSAKPRIRRHAHRYFGRA